MGTEGGEFLDPDRGTLLATGQRRILRVDLGNFDCGNTVIFGFTEQGGDDPRLQGLKTLAGNRWAW